MIHMLRVKIVFLIRSLMSRFIARKQLFTKDDPKSEDNILKTAPLNKKLCKKAFLIDVGTKAKVLFSCNVIGDEHEEQFRMEFLTSIELLLNTFWRIYHMITR